MGSAQLGVIGALVGVIIGGIGSYLTTSITTARTLHAQRANTLRELDAAHGQSLQEMQAPVYEKAIAALIYRRDKREHDLSPVRWDKDTERITRPTLGDYHPRNWYESQSQLALYASQEVLDANTAANHAHEIILSLTRKLADLREDAAAIEPADNDARTKLGLKHKEILEEIRAALKKAATADDSLIQVMRKSVHTRPSQYLPALPANTRKLKTITGRFRRNRIARPSTTLDSQNGGSRELPLLRARMCPG